MPAPSQTLKRLRKIAMSLRDATESETWGKPHFRVNDRIFCGYGEENDQTCIGCKLEKPHAAKVVKRPRDWLSPFGGRFGWISIDVRVIKDWLEIESFIRESYSLIAPKRSLDKLSDSKAPRKTAKKKTK